MVFKPLCPHGVEVTYLLPRLPLHCRAVSLSLFFLPPLPLCRPSSLDQCQELAPDMHAVHHYVCAFSLTVRVSHLLDSQLAQASQFFSFSSSNFFFSSCTRCIDIIVSLHILLTLFHHTHTHRHLSLLLDFEYLLSLSLSCWNLNKSQSSSPGFGGWDWWLRRVLKGEQEQIFS